MATKRFLVVVMLTFAGTALPAAQEVGRETLAGLPGVHVVVEEVNPDAQRDGVTTSGIQTQAELLLRQAGLKVLSSDEWQATPGRPMLRLNLTVARNQLSIYGFNLDVQLLQTVALARDPSIFAACATWTVPNLVRLSAASALRTAARDAVQDQTEAFINAFLAANPGR